MCIAVTVGSQAWCWGSGVVTHRSLGERSNRRALPRVLLLLPLLCLLLCLLFVQFASFVISFMRRGRLCVRVADDPSYNSPLLLSITPPWYSPPPHVRHNTATLHLGYMWDRIYYNIITIYTSKGYVYVCIVPHTV